MKAPQIIIIVLMSIGLLLQARNHGQPQTDENFWKGLLSTGIVIALLVWGGFFN